MSLTDDEMAVLDTVLDVIVLAGATSDIAPYITHKAEGFLAALAGVDPPLTVVPLRAEASAQPGALSEMRANAAARRVAGAATALNKVATWSALNRPETPSLLDAIAEWERVWDGSLAEEPGALREALDKAVNSAWTSRTTPTRVEVPEDRWLALVQAIRAALSREEATSE